jgi:hypothetical protein
MLYSVLIYGAEGELRTLSKAQDEALVAKHLRLHEKFTKERKLGPVVRLMPTTAATTLRLGDEPVLMDGPFAETKEQLLGLYVLNCASLEEAIEAARDIGTACTARSLEIRPVSWYDGGLQLSEAEVAKRSYSG